MAVCADQSGWEAELDLGFERRADKTVLAKRHQRGPLTVQRPFYPEGGLCHVYLLHPPGGVVAGDRLRIDVQSSQETEVLMTTPGAGKYYRSSGAWANQRISMQLDKHATLEWLPQESILYEGARLKSDVSIELADTADFLGWEILALGRPASSEGFSSGEALLSWRIFREGRPLFLEKMHLHSSSIHAKWGLNGHTACGTLFACHATTESLEAVRKLIGDDPARGVTLIDQLLICRISTHKCDEIRRFFTQVRAVIREEILSRQDYLPRIWAT